MNLATMQAKKVIHAACALACAAGLVTGPRLLTPRAEAHTTAALLRETDFPGDTTTQAVLPTDRLAFVRRVSGVDDEVFVMSADGSNQVNITNNPATDNYPDWSPDGARIVFASTRTGNGDIYVMNADGTNVANITVGANTGFPDYQPRWSPDGSKIAFVSDRDGDSEIYVMNADGSGLLQLTFNNSPDLSPTWSPDGSKIAFSKNFDIYVMNADGTSEVQVTSTNSINTVPDWSPDGSKIAFARDPFSSVTAIYVVNVNGTGLVKLSDNSASDTDPAWAPDGSTIAYSSQRGGNLEIYLMNADGSNERGIGAAAVLGFTPVWRPRTSNPTGPAVQFELTAYNISEGAGRAVLTVTRAGDASAPLSVNFSTVDDPEPVPCATVNGKAYARCDYATTIETIRWAAGDTQPKTVAVPLIDDGRAEGPETLQVRLSGPQGGSLGGVGTATLTIQDNETADGPNPINGSPFFVRQQYLDFLSREPEPGEPWTGVLSGCADVFNLDPNSASAGCDRILVSKSFFESPEFQLKGFYAFLFYRVAFDRRPEYAEIIPDMRSLAGATAGEVFAARAAYATAITQRPEFAQAYGGLTNQQYVDALLGRYGVQQVTTEDPANFEGSAQVTLTRQQLADALDNNSLSRAQVLRAVVQSREVDAAEYHGAFVAMQYYGYLRRTPEEDGYQAWLRVIRQDPNNIRTMVNGFMNSTEYRLRFGQP